MSIEKKLAQVLEYNQILIQEPMKKHTSFKVGGPADYYVRPKLDQVTAVLQLCEEERLPFVVIGNGSNLLVGDRGIRGLVMEIGLLASDVKASCSQPGFGEVAAQAGASLAKAAHVAAKSGLRGMEPLSGIPGSIGGAVVMNAGAYGGEVKDVLKEAKVLCKDGQVKTYALEELDLSYRHSILPETGGIVLEAVFVLKEGDREEIRMCMETIKAQREAKQPLEYPSAGSTFKRPQGYFAGKLITDAGLRGFSIGGAQVSEKHGGFVINRGGATAQDIRSLIELIQTYVCDKFGVLLETEVKIIGEF